MSATSSSSGLGSSFTMPSGNDKHLQMKQFISVALEYNKTRAAVSANQLNRHLQIIGVAIDLSTFDPHSSVVAEFFVSLHELLYGLESHSNLLWAGVSVLQQACRNRAAHHALIHTYHFLPILSRHLGDQLTRDRKICLLNLVQELTYGIRITWQEPHIPHLIATMVKWIRSGETNVVNLSLGILINLCYKNLPAIYALMRCVDTKLFMRTVMSLKGNNIESQIFKLLIILENINGEVSKDYIFKFVAATFESVGNGLKNRDAVLLRHVVDFFIDVKSQQKQHAAFMEFKNYATYIEKLIGIVTSTNESGDNQINDPECMARLFEFLLALVQLNLQDIIPLHPQLAELALNWVQTEHVSTTALKLLRCVATARGVEIDKILQPLANGLQVLLVALNTGCISEDDTQPQTAESQDRLTGLFHLLREMVKSTSLREHVLQGLKIESIYKIFTPLTCLAFSPRIRTDDLFTSQGTLLYINALALVQAIAPLDKQWETLYLQLMEQKQVHSMIAHAFCKGDPDTKSLVFEIARTGEFQTDKISQAFCDLQPLFDYNSTPNNDRGINPFTEHHLPYTIMSIGQEEKLDDLIDKLKESISSNQVANVATSDVMELFEYKMAAMGHAERAAQISLEAAGKQVAHTNHRLAQMSAESSRLHQMLLHSQQCQEQTTAKLNKVEENMRQTVVRLTKSRTLCSEFENKLKACQGQLKVKTNELRASEDQHQLLLTKYNAAVVKISDLEEKVNDMTDKNTDLTKMRKKMEDKIFDLDKKVEEKKEALVKATQKITKLSEELSSYEELCKRNEEQMQQKEKDYTELQGELEDYKAKLNWIVQISQNKCNKQPS